MLYVVHSCVSLHCIIVCIFYCILTVRPFIVVNMKHVVCCAFVCISALYYSVYFLLYSDGQTFYCGQYKEE